MKCKIDFLTSRISKGRPMGRERRTIHQNIHNNISKLQRISSVWVGYVIRMFSSALLLTFWKHPFATVSKVGNENLLPSLIFLIPFG